MAIAKKLRFVSRNINKKLNVEKIPFPPSKFKYDDLKLHHLGLSDKDDLHPTEEECGVDILKAIHESEIGQFIYCSDNGDFYEVLVYIDDFSNIILKSIRTRFQ